jgi:hypothetical protein
LNLFPTSSIAFGSTDIFDTLEEVDLLYNISLVVTFIPECIFMNVFLGFYNQNELRKKQQSTRLETNLV